nr:hypothetical protein B0A51_00577 [Rachicladosporium sp. CCFEE 5018]
MFDALAEVREIQELIELAHDHPSPSFPYDQLDPSKRQIRLLRLGTNESCEDETMTFELAIHSLDDVPQYQALSYCWGTEAATRTILIDGYPFQVRRDLFDYLRIRRNENDRAWLYVDAICINQLDLKEKSTQVTLMGDVYRNATEVVAWLGSNSIEVERPLSIHDAPEMWQLYFDMAALSLVPDALRVPEGRTSDRMLHTDLLREWLDIGAGSWDDDPGGSAVVWVLDPILDCPYWTRLWAVQEMLLAQQLTIRYKSLVIPWRVLCECLRYGMCFMGDGEEPSSRLSQLNRYLRTPIFPQMKDLSNRLRVYWLLNEKVRTTDRARAGRLLLNDAVYTYAEQDCTLWCDKIYGLYGVVPKVGPMQASYEDPDRATAQAMVQGLTELRSVAQIDGNWAAMRFNSHAYICRLLGVLGKDLRSAGTRNVVKAVCRSLTLDIRSVEGTWARMGVNWERFCRYDANTLLGKTIRWYYTSVGPLLSETGATVWAILSNPTYALDSATARDAAQLGSTVRQISQHYARCFDFGVLLSDTECLSLSDQTTPLDRMLAEKHVILIEQFPIPEGATKLATAGLHVLTTALARLSHAEDDISRAVAELCSGLRDRLQGVVDRSDEGDTKRETSPQAQRDAYQIIAYIDRKRRAIAQAGFDWMPCFAAQFPMQLDNTEEGESAWAYPRWACQEADTIFGELLTEPDARRTAQIESIRTAYEANERLVVLTRVDMYMVPGSTGIIDLSVRSTKNKQQRER